VPEERGLALSRSRGPRFGLVPLLVQVEGDLATEVDELKLGLDPSLATTLCLLHPCH
jgi:hypothetical protein